MQVVEGSGRASLPLVQAQAGLHCREWQWQCPGRSGRGRGAAAEDTQAEQASVSAVFEIGVQTSRREPISPNHHWQQARNKESLPADGPEIDAWWWLEKAGINIDQIRRDWSLLLHRQTWANGKENPGGNPQSQFWGGLQAEDFDHAREWEKAQEHNCKSKRKGDLGEFGALQVIAQRLSKVSFFWLKVP